MSTALRISALGLLLLAAGATTRAQITAYVFTTIAGSAGSAGDADGNGANARFRRPTRLAVDEAGNVYVLDGNQTLRKISAEGTVTTLAGLSGARGIVDGVGAGARLNSGGQLDTDAGGLVVESTGTLALIELDGPRGAVLRRVTTTGAVTTVARWSGAFWNATGLALTPAGGLYTADTSNHLIRQVTPGAGFTTAAGQVVTAEVPGILGFGTQTVVTGGYRDGPASLAQFREPWDLAADAGGNLYVLERGNNAVRKIAAGGAVSTLAIFDNTVPPVGSVSFLNRDVGCIAADADGNTYATFPTLGIVRRISRTGEVSVIGGVRGVLGAVDGAGGNARFLLPSGIAVDRAGNLYIADTGNHTIRKGVPLADAALRIVAHPASVTVPLGGWVVLSVEATGANLVYQWLHEGVAVPGATEATLIRPSAAPTQAGRYTVEVRNALGTTVSAPATVTLTTTASWLANISVCSEAGTGADTLILGFTVAGPIARPLMVRAIGPTLANFGISGALADPTLRLAPLGGSVIAQNDNWATGSAGDALVSAMAAAGAFSLPSGSRDAVLFVALSAGPYAAEVGGGAGMALIEAYDLTGNAKARLTNLSVRAPVRAGDGALVAGFVIVGPAAKTVLVRGIGPRLADFGVSGFLGAPVLQLRAPGGALLAENNGWNGVELVLAAERVAAFPLNPGSPDAALLVTLPPGAYTASVTSRNAAGGIALMEVYDLDP